MQIIPVRSDVKKLLFFIALTLLCTDLSESQLPQIQSTMPSPEQYGYRTKITPHFQAPPTKADRDILQKDVAEGKIPDWLRIGFNIQGQNKVIDIEVDIV